MTRVTFKLTNGRHLNVNAYGTIAEEIVQDRMPRKTRLHVGTEAFMVDGSFDDVCAQLEDPVVMSIAEPHLDPVPPALKAAHEITLDAPFLAPTIADVMETLGVNAKGGEPDETPPTVDAIMALLDGENVRIDGKLYALTEVHDE